MSAAPPVPAWTANDHEAILSHRALGAERILGKVYALKFRYFLTLFVQCAPHHGRFKQALEVVHDGKPDPITLK